jgi:hypothetical protein
METKIHIANHRPDKMTALLISALLRLLESDEVQRYPNARRCPNRNARRSGSEVK